MNFIGKNIGGESGQRRQQQKLGGDGVGANSFEEEDEEEKQITSSTGQLFTSPSSSSPSSHHLQPPSFHPQHSFHNHHTSRGWMHGGEPSSRVNDPMMVDYSSIPGAMPAPDNNNNNSNSNSNSNNNNNNNTENHDEQQTSGGMMMMVEREHMFDKVVTPSDVGKLNRLVIPKQHAERYFPLDSSSNEKGLLLNFEDRNGKPWRFRYSYWNSSQSYVMTKGWSRFVKDKKLDAGDIVSFQRGVGGSAKDRLFIDWRHRPDAPAPPYHLSSNLAFPLSHHQFSLNRNNIHPWNPLFLQSQPAAPSRSHSNLMLPPPSYRYGNTSNPYHNIGTGSVVNVNQGGSGLGLGSGSGPGSVIYFRSGGGSGIPTQQHHVDMIQMHQRNVIGMGIGMDPPAPQPPTPSALVYESVPVVHGKAAAKRLRLFGVNMDCPISDDDDQDYDPPSEMSPTMVSSSTPIIPNSIENYHHDHFSNHYPPTSSSSTIPYLQLRPYEEESHFHQTATMSSSTSDALNKTTKSSSSRMTLDLDF